MTSYWLATTETTAIAKLTEDVSVDVAVIGGGVTGLSTAWELQSRGKRVAVLDAGRIAAATTGHTTAKLTSLHTDIYSRITGMHGWETARLYAASQQDAIQRVRRIAAELEIDCDLEERSAYAYMSAEGAQRETEAAQRAGLPAEFVTESGLPFPIAGAVRVSGQAQFHPRKYLLRLAAAFCRRGGLVFEGTRVTGLDGTEVRADTGHSVRARDVVVATHAPMFDKSLLVTRLSFIREFVVAAPIPPDRDPRGIYVTPEDGVRSVRTAPMPDGQRLLIVTGEQFAPGSTGVRQRLQRLVSWTRDHFGVDHIAYHWAAQDPGTADGLPFVGHMPLASQHLWTATGFGGWGMSNGVMAGSLLAALITGTDVPEWSGIYSPARLHLRTEGPSVVASGAKYAWRLVADRAGIPGEEVLADITNGHGAVVRLDGEHRAVYRDDEGELHAVAATCTHLGCTVAFNDAERSWDCPCHGSRFDVDGTVLEGPANAPLARHELRVTPPAHG
jgi:glycine/D-amino acid oxidase-like deaminating enzyme/nitrite reductase/ring-hydroxylating ferredoxin subunit